nr:ATP-binding protein [Kineococcus aurantiacus]
MRRRLHDEVGPGLATAAMDLDVALTVLGSDPATARRLLEGVRATITDDVALVRGLAYRLYPPEVEQLGLAGAVEDVAQQHLTGADVDVDVRVGAPLGAAVEVAVYRIAAEALRNAGRHARAGRVRVRVVDGPGEVLLEVSDDGCGTAGSRPGAGLLGMRERAEELGGELQVVSPPGTTVRARLPLAPEVRP